MNDLENAAGTLHGLPLDIDAIRNLSDDAGTELTSISHPGLFGLPNDVPVLIDRKNGKVVSVKHLLEEYRERPSAKRGTAVVKTLESFVALTNRHKTENSAIFAETDWKKPSLISVIDYHEATNDGDPDNCKHRISYPFPLSEEWDTWIAQDGKKMTQEDFAQWIEDHIPDLAAPEDDEIDGYLDTFSLKTAYPNELVALSRGLQVNVTGRVKNSVTLQSGAGEITFEEEHRDATGAKLIIPGLFILSISPFYMGEKARIPVRLRYRVNNGAVMWTFHLYRPDIYVTEQVRRDLAAAKEKTALPAFEGTPEVSA